ncbi:MAG: LptF/LptG family permease [Pirellulales bacterium]
MRILTRYVLAEFLSVLILSLVGMTALIVLALIGREAIDQGIGLLPMLRLIPYACPIAMTYAVPGTVLLASAAVFGRIAAFNEVIGIKSMGISPLSIIWPVLIATAFVSLATVWLNDTAFSWGRLGIRRVLLDSAVETAYRVLATRKTYHTSQMTIHVRGVEGRRLIQPTIQMRPSGTRPGGTITAREAQLRSNLDTRELTVELYDTVLDFGPQMGILPGSQNYVITLAEFSRKGGSARRPAETPLVAIPAEINRQRDLILLLDQQCAARTVGQLMTGDFWDLTDARWTDYRQQTIHARHTLYRLNTEPHRRFAVGFSCLCFAVVGVPMAIRRRHGEFMASFFFCFLPILLVYYPFLMISIDHAKEGSWPAESVWVGNLVMVAWGALLLRRIRRY